MKQNTITIKFAPGRALTRKQAPGATSPRKPHPWKQAALLLTKMAAWCEQKNQDRISRLSRANLKRITSRDRERIDPSLGNRFEPF